MKNWKNLSLFGKEILDNDSFRLLQEIIRTQNFGTPVEAFKGAVMNRQPDTMFKTAISDFTTAYRQIADDMIEKREILTPEEGRKAIELIKRCEVLRGMSQTFSEANEAFRRANVEKGKDYTGGHSALWKRLERTLGLEESRPERGRISAEHLQNHSFG